MFDGIEPRKAYSFGNGEVVAIGAAGICEKIHRDEEKNLMVSIFL
jgi:hypothetical protein